MSEPSSCSICDCGIANHALEELWENAGLSPQYSTIRRTCLCFAVVDVGPSAIGYMLPNACSPGPLRLRSCASVCVLSVCKDGCRPFTSPREPKQEKGQSRTQTFCDEGVRLDGEENSRRGEQVEGGKQSGQAKSAVGATSRRNLKKSSTTFVRFGGTR